MLESKPECGAAPQGSNRDDGMESRSEAAAESSLAVEAPPTSPQMAPEPLDTNETAPARRGPGSADPVGEGTGVRDVRPSVHKSGRRETRLSSSDAEWSHGLMKGTAGNPGGRAGLRLYSTSSTTTVRPERRWAREASMNGSRSPSSTSDGALETCPVRRSFTIW